MLLLGALAAQAQAAPAGAGAYDLLETTELASDTGTIEFTNLDSYASSYQHLQFRGVLQCGGPYATNRCRIKVNGSDANLRRHVLGSFGSSVQSGSATPYGGSLVFSDRLDTGNFSAFVMDALDFGSTSKTKTFRYIWGCNDTSEPSVGLYSVLWNSTSAFTSLLFGAGNTTIDTNLITGSRISIYGLKAS